MNGAFLYTYSLRQSCDSFTSNTTKSNVIEALAPCAAIVYFDRLPRFASVGFGSITDVTTNLKREGIPLPTTDSPVLTAFRLQQ